MSGTSDQQKPRVKWLLVWAALFVYIYPMASLVFTIMSHHKFTMSAGPFAVAMAGVYTFVAWLRLSHGESLSPQPVRNPVPRKEIARILFYGFGFLFGLIGKSLTGRPSWAEVILYAIVIPASFAASNFLFKRSDLIATQSNTGMTMLGGAQ